jgi:hypothetical protein
MSFIADDEIVPADGPAPQRARLYSWLLDHLAKFPGRVAAVTFAAGTVVTVCVVVVDGDKSPTTVVSLLATLWALFFAVMIYLLTARDTDKVLEQIADLHEQLATALAAPEEEGEPVEVETADADGEPIPTTTGLPDTPSVKAADRTPDRVSPDDLRRQQTPANESRGERRPAPTNESQNRGRPGGDSRRAPRLLVGADAIVDGVPADLLDSWVSATGQNRDQLSRAWTRDPRSERQWVLETVGRERWVVYSKGARGVGVMSLDASARGRSRRPIS